MNSNLRAFLDMIAWAEIGTEMLLASDNGYNVIAGSVPGMIITFSSYHRHPGVLIDMDGKVGGLQSTAAGRYQILAKIWAAYRSRLRLRGFYPEDQDRIAIQLIRECRALVDIDIGDIAVAIHKCRSRWASLPGAGYGQPEKKISALLEVYRTVGGTFNVTTLKNNPEKVK